MQRHVFDECLHPSKFLPVNPIWLQRIVALAMVLRRVLFSCCALSYLVDSRNLYHLARRSWASGSSSLYAWPSYDAEKFAQALVSRTPFRTLADIRSFTCSLETAAESWQNSWHGFWMNIRPRWDLYRAQPIEAKEINDIRWLPSVESP